LTVIPHKVEKQSETTVKTSFRGAIWPVQGKVLTGKDTDIGVEKEGIDILAPKGSPIRAAMGGTVVYSGNKIKSYGNMIIMKHKSDLYTIYAHNQKNLVKYGDIIKKGTLIGFVGDTGRTDGKTLLFFAIRFRHNPLNPLKLLP
ncbi:MAG: M23 family metallopeptidase, partial [Thermodesulfobacteriota bacterium]|nr:M23 family metallopeptidase [Thermodesulfobacteriota bacterium]